MFVPGIHLKPAPLDRVRADAVAAGAKQDHDGGNLKPEVHGISASLVQGNGAVNRLSLRMALGFPCGKPRVKV